ncbi:MAG: ParA family protein [Methylovulum sp.]|nr:ParA family protein [Methylovulum sp.]MCF7999220.1 ParA family protein [Methylovulum sp.]
MKVVAIINQKGGVGKTTTSVNLCHALAELGKKVTVIDLDPQGHLSVSFGVRNLKQSGIDAVMLGEKGIDEQVVQIRENLRLITSGPRLQEIEQLTSNSTHRADLLKKSLTNSDMAEQDFLFIDCPPSSGLLIVNALYAAEEILIPMTSDFLALQGLSHLMGTVKKFERALKKQYTARLVISRYTPNRKISKQVLNVLLSHFPSQILATAIRETTLLSECPSFGKTILEYSPESRSAKDFRKLAIDFMEGRVMYGRK